MMSRKTEVEVIARALDFYHDNLVDDQNDGGDHGDEIDLVEELMYVYPGGQIKDRSRWATKRSVG